MVLGTLALLMALTITASDTTLTVKVNQPESEIQLLNKEGKVEALRMTDNKGAITITVEPGKYQLKVYKKGFEIYTKDFDIESGGKRTMTVKLARPKDKTTPKWRMQVAELPPEKQVEAVAKKLKELNPGFDGKITHRIDSGVVTSVAFVTNNVTDLFPIRVLEGLTELTCNGSEPELGALADLTPLKGMSLTSLNCRNNPQLSDLAPLKEMPLGGLHCNNTQISDLRPLKGMKLGFLNCSSSPVSDLSPLSGMPFGELLCDNTKVSDLSPLKGMSIESLGISGSEVSSLLPLKGLKLRNLGCNKTRVSDLSPLKGMPLKALYCTETEVSNFSPLQDLPLTVLSFDFDPNRDSQLIRSIKTLTTINSQPAAEFLRQNAGK